MEKETTKEQDDIVEEDVINRMNTFGSEKLADIIIMHRYLGIYETISVAAMKELATRRENNDTFEYEEYIKNNLAKLPKLTIDLKQMNNLVAKLRSIL